jgi:hypothetical protein
MYWLDRGELQMQTSHAVVKQDEAQESPTCPPVANLCSVDWERIESEDRLGCARGVVWAIVFEVVVVIAAVVYWKFRHMPH